MASTFPLPTSSLKKVYGTVIHGSPPGFTSWSRRKFATRIPRNQSKVLLGGIFGCLELGAGPLVIGLSGRLRAAGAGILVRTFGCLVGLMISPVRRPGE